MRDCFCVCVGGVGVVVDGWLVFTRTRGLGWWANPTERDGTHTNAAHPHHRHQVMRTRPLAEELSGGPDPAAVHEVRGLFLSVFIVV